MALTLVFTEGHSGDVDLTAEVAGLLALMLLHAARRPARFAADGSLVPLAAQDRSLWDGLLITEGVALLQGALARDRLGEYQAQAAIAALHAELAALAPLDPALPRYAAVAAHLHEADGDRVRAAELFAGAARVATNTAERDHLARQAARLR